MKRKNVLFAGILVVFFLNFFIASASNYVGNTVEFNKFIRHNLAAHQAFVYGDNGLAVQHETVYLEDVLKNGVADCGSFATKLAYDLRKEGFMCNIVGLSSHYADAQHAVVEAVFENKKYVLDPTNGLYYPCSLNELLNNPSLSSDRVKQHGGDIMDSYTNKTFWEEIYGIYQYDGEPYYLEPLNSRIEYATIKGTVVEEHDLDKMLDQIKSSYGWILPGQEYPCIEICLEENINIGYLGVMWYPDSIWENVEFSYRNGGRWMNFESGENIWRTSSYWECYPGGIVTDAIRIRQKGSGQEFPMMINEIYLMEGLEDTIEAGKEN